MIRITPRDAKWCLLYLNRLLRKSPEDETMETILMEEERAIELKDEISDAERAIIGHIRRILDGDIELRSIGDLTSHLEKLLNSNSNQDRKLIDSIVEIVSRPLAAERLSGRTLRDLRRALLNAEELAGVEDRDRFAHLHCSSCGRTLYHQEMATIRQDPEDRGIMTISCTSCVTPRFVSCKSKDCDTLVQIPDKLMPWFGKGHRCVDHREGKKEEAQGPPPPVDLNIIQAWNNARMGGRVILGDLNDPE